MAMVVLAGMPARSAHAVQGEGTGQAAPYVASIDGMTPISYGWQRFPGFSPNDYCATCQNAWAGYCQEKLEECYHHSGNSCGNGWGLRCRIAGWLHPSGDTCSSGACDRDESCCHAESERCDTCEATECGGRCGGHLFRLFGLLKRGECCESRCGDTFEEAAAVDDSAATEAPPVPNAPEFPADDASI